MKSSYQILESLCKVRNKSSVLTQTNPDTPRAMFIRETLESMGVHFIVDYFSAGATNSQNVVDCFNNHSNITVLFEAEGTDDTIVFVAHHDINNPNSENCQDNSASVANLIALAGQLKDKKLNRNVAIVFTDGEEFGGRGAKHLSKLINAGYYGNVEYVVNLELTANGSQVWCDLEDSPLVDKLEEVVCRGEARNLWVVGTPFNDSWVLRREEIDSVCIGTLTENQMDKAFNSGYCDTWALCHKENDTFKDNADRESMDEFVELLEKLI